MTHPNLAALIDAYEAAREAVGAASRRTHRHNGGGDAALCRALLDAEWALADGLEATEGRAVERNGKRYTVGPFGRVDIEPVAVPTGSGPLGRSGVRPNGTVQGNFLREFAGEKTS